MCHRVGGARLAPAHEALEGAGGADSRLGGSSRRVSCELWSGNTKACGPVVGALIALLRLLLGRCWASASASTEPRAAGCMVRLLRTVGRLPAKRGSRDAWSAGNASEEGRSAASP